MTMAKPEKSPISSPANADTPPAQQAAAPQQPVQFQFVPADIVGAVKQRVADVGSYLHQTPVANIDPALLQPYISGILSLLSMLPKPAQSPTAQGAAQPAPAQRPN
jgi:hypothetical protein